MGVSSPKETGMFTRNHPAKFSAQRAARGVVRAARAGAGRDAWILEALLELQMEPGAERFGVWLEPPPGDETIRASRVVFRGEVRERGQGKAPGRWTSLSVELPLPLDLLSIGKTAELTLEGELHDPLFGPTLGMRHLLWVPVFGQNLLRGLILVAAQDAGSPLPRVLAEEVAAELALALEWQELSWRILNLLPGCTPCSRSTRTLTRFWRNLRKPARATTVQREEAPSSP
jgi:hypothetical protein